MPINNEEKRVLVINRDTAAQEIVRNDLESEGTKVVCVTSSADALRAFLTQEFTLVILEAGLSESEGHTLLDAMQAIRPIPILVLSTKSGDHHATLKPSPVTYKGKPFDMQESLALAQETVRLFLNTEPQEAYCYTLVRGKDLVIDPPRREVTLKGKSLKLTKTEFDLLLCLATNPGQVLSREQLYAQVWSEDTAYNVDEVVKAHIKAIRKKLAHADMEYIKNVWGVGYKFQSEKGGE